MSKLIQQVCTTLTLNIHLLFKQSLTGNMKTNAKIHVKRMSKHGETKPEGNSFCFGLFIKWQPGGMKAGGNTLNWISHRAYFTRYRHGRLYYYTIFFHETCMPITYKNCAQLKTTQLSQAHREFSFPHKMSDYWKISFTLPCIPGVILLLTSITS